MIRINLIPVRQVRKVQAGQRQLLLFIGLVLVEVGAMFFLYNSAADENDERDRTLARLNKEVAVLKKEVGDYDLLQSQRARLISQKNVINQLNKSRTGPVWMMREMSHLLSVGGRPTFDQKAYDELIKRNPSAAFNVKWNPRRLWIESINERSKSLTLTGKAKDHDDVAEFLKRLTVSVYFDQRSAPAKRPDYGWKAGAQGRQVFNELYGEVLASPASRVSC